MNISKKKRFLSVIIEGYNKFYQNLIIATFFDVAVSLSNFNKLTKK